MKRNKRKAKRLVHKISFMEMLKKKLVTWKDIYDFIDEWHLGDYDCSVYQFLGMTESEYASWCERTLQK